MWEQRADEELLGAIAREPLAFSAFYRRHVDEVLGFLARRCRDPEQAADLTAEVFAAVLLQARRYRAERGTPTAWLFAIAANKHSDAWRRSAAEDRARRRLGVRDVPLTGEDVAYIEARAAEVEALMADLPAEQRAAVRGRVLEDRGYAELARAAGVTPAAVRQRVSRGLALLRGRLERESL
jgi:RNA polymerase sigma-70 factor (ECF subfamily)